MDEINRINALRAELEKLSYEYYVQDKPSRSDQEYDLSLIHISEPTRRS